MTYEEVKNLMPANRRWCKWISCLYLQKYRGTIRIRYGYRYAHSQVMGIWYPNGTFKFVSACYYSSQRWRINHFLPAGYSINSHRYYSFLEDHNKDLDDAKAFYIRTDDRSNRYYDPHISKKKWIVITKHGVQSKLGPTLKKIRSKLRAEDYLREKPRRRGRYWLRKARGVFRKRCGKSYHQGCMWNRTWPRPVTNWTGECGCVVYTKKAISRDTVKTIMDEKNATVRTSKIQIYGIEKFFTDAGARTINKEAAYELMTLNTGRADRISDRWGREQTANVVISALRMKCSTTGKVYVNTVPSELRTVREALDWMYETDHYLERVGKQT